MGKIVVGSLVSVAYLIFMILGGRAVWEGGHQGKKVTNCEILYINYKGQYSFSPTMVGNFFSKAHKLLQFNILF